MRICLYTETALPKIGGQESVVDALARWFCRLGHQAVVLAQNPRRAVRVNDASLPYPVVRHRRFISTRHFVRWYRYWLLRLHRQQRFDVVHCHSVYPCGYLAALLKARLNIPIVITSHGRDVWSSGSRLAKPGLRERHVEAVRSADALVAISRFTIDGYRQLDPGAKQIVRIPNGVDLDAYADPIPRPAGMETIAPGQYALFLGRLHRRKGVDLLLEAAAQLRGARSTCQIVIAGDGPERPALEDQAKRLELFPQLRFLGPVQGAVKTWLLQNALCVVIPSREWEAFPLVVLEAYAAGAGVIATRIPGLEDVVEHGKTGLLVPPESPTALAQALSELFADFRRAQELRLQARLAAQAYGWQAVAEQHLQLYASLQQEQSLPQVA